jgi:hypothetical protein
MVDLTPDGQRIIADAARRYSVSPGAVRALFEALLASNGAMAQFNHPDLGGMGQWSSGGMIMIGDMFNNELKNRVNALCADLSETVQIAGALIQHPRSSQSQSQSRGNGGRFSLSENSLFVRADARDWWPSELGAPGSTGAQNDMRYAWFPDRRRLALDVNGRISIHDTGEHSITGFSQQQDGGQTLTFTSQHGVVRLDSLPRVAGAGPEPDVGPEAEPVTGRSPETQAGSDIFVSIERLTGLRDKGLLSEAEFAARKTELLKRL